MNVEQSWKSEGPATGRWLKELQGPDDTCAFCIASINLSVTTHPPSFLHSSASIRFSSPRLNIYTIVSRASQLQQLSAVF